MKRYKLIILTFLSFSFTGIGYAQGEKTAIRRATREYKEFAYVKTTDILLKVANKGYKSEDMFKKLGNAFYFNNKMEDAAKWYGELMAMNETMDDPEYYFRYALALKSVEQYEESDKWMAKFHKANGGDLRAQAFDATKNYLSRIEAIETGLEVHNLDLNSEYSDFGANQYKDQLIFSSSRSGDRKYLWNEQPYLDLYMATKTNDSTSYGDVKAYEELINTKYHESSASFTPNDSIMFFTRNNYYNRKYKSDTEGVNKLKIFRTRLEDDGQWGDLESIHFNSDQYSVAHPSVNSTGDKIYFASDMAGTTGLSDIYMADLDADGTVGTPVNLGKKINTEGQESFPYINSKGDLFYSSNGYPGLGGMDVYVIRDFETKYEKNAPLAAKNLGKPINSPFDDFGYYENLGTEEGFVTSNRPGGKGDDDIYSFRALDPRDCRQEVAGVVRDKTTNALLANATVTLLDGQGEQIEQLQVGEDATYKFNLDCGKEYLLRGEKEEYTSNEKRIVAPRIDIMLGSGLEQDLLLEKEKPPFDLEDDIRDILGIKIIYFDFDKDNIREPDATAELQKVIAFMKAYPSVHIDVRSHTDCRGTNAYNEDLSARRNKSTINYIVNGGIDLSRLTGRGYGENVLTNECADGVPCSEAKHDLNRRSEFIITKK